MTDVLRALNRTSGDEDRELCVRGSPTTHRDD